MKKIEKYKEIIISISIIAIIGFVFFEDYNKKSKEAPENITKSESSVSKKQLSNEEINKEIDDVLNVLMEIHYISVVEREDTSPESLILDELTESMNDLNKLKALSYKTEKISMSSNDLIATTGLVLHSSVLLLIKSYNDWINYLRGVNINTLEISEFQYQMALFGTSTHDTYINLAKGAFLFPMITVEFAKEEGKENIVNEEVKSHFLKEIDNLFGDILIKDNISYEKTKVRYAIPVLIQGYKDFFNN